MKALIVYESMFGNTRQIAEAIGHGMSQSLDVRVANVNDVTPDVVEHADLLVIGAPTHAFSLSLPASREEARKLADDTARGLTLEPQALREGVREFLDRLEPAGSAFAAFDTRVTPDWMNASARKHITRALTAQGHPEVASTSFRVDRAHRLRTGEVERAERWGHAVAVDAVALLTSSVNG